MDKVQTWDLYLNQALAAIKFNVSESSKFSPYFLIYNRDPLLPINNILKPRRKYYVDQEHQIALEQQHKSFVLVHKYLKKAKKKQAKYANKNRNEMNNSCIYICVILKLCARSVFEGRFRHYFSTLCRSPILSTTSYHERCMGIWVSEYVTS